MKTRFLAAALAVFAAAPVAADPVLGTWQTEVDDGSYAYVELAPCSGKVCGTIARTFKAEGEYRSPNLGKQLVIDMVPRGNGRYDGQVWRPSNDRIYLGKMRLDGDSLKLSGCVAGGLLCSAQTWSRLN